MRISGAGVLCYTHLPNGGGLAVLLGKEKETPGWRQGSNKWSSFSGKVDSTEEACQGAAREFVEESLAVVPLVEGGAVPVNIDEIARLLSTDRDMSTGGGMLEVRGKNESPCRYVVYIQHIPYEDYSVRFQETRKQLLELDAIFRAFQACRKGTGCLPRCVLPGARLSPVLVVVAVRLLMDGVTLQLTLCDETSGQKNTIEVEISEAGKKQVVAFAAAWEAVLDRVSTVNDPLLSHPAVTVHRLHGHVVGAFVKKSYLEKSEIRWWSLNDLEHTAANTRASGRQASDAFRHYFLESVPLLAAAVRKRAAGEAMAIAEGTWRNPEGKVSGCFLGRSSKRG